MERGARGGVEGVMRCVVRAGCAVIAVGAMAGVARGWCPELRQVEQLDVVPAGGGVFLVQEVESSSCRLLMVGGGKWVPLERQPRWGSGVIVYRPVRALEPGVVYRVVGVDEDGERVGYGRAVAGAAADRVAPRWRRAPRVVWAGYRAGCLMDVALVELEMAVEDESAVRVTIEAQPVDGGGGEMFAVVQPEDERAVVEWPMQGERFMRAGVDYAARMCAEDAAGNRSCAPAPAMFKAPEPAPEPRLPVELWRGGLVEMPVVGAPPPVEERMERVRAPGARVDWRCAGAGAAGALLVLAVVVALGWARRARLRRATRAV